MSHLRAPAPRADRREGGRHGRPVNRTAPALPDTRIRPQLLRLAVLPPVAVALCGCAAVLFTVRSGGAHHGPALWAVLAGALSVALAAVLIAAVAAGRAAASVSERIGALRRNTARGEADLKALVEGLRRGEGPPVRRARSGPPDEADEFELLAADLAHAHEAAVATVVRAAQLSSRTSSEQKLEVFVNLARRLQSLVHREISILDELENDIEDPDLLKGLFHVDHLATRIRRHSENLAVLGGAVSRRQWSNPVPMTEVLRSAIAEVEQYHRVRLVPPVEGELRGHAVADVIHLLAELVENATVFSAPHTQVLLRASLVTSGLAVEVEDRGLGMPLGEQQRMNALLAHPDQVNVAGLLADGRIGLFVVSQLARRHGILVRLQTNIYGGVQAVLVVPAGLLGPAPAADAGPWLPPAAEAQPRLPYVAGTVPQLPHTAGPTAGPGETAALPRQTAPEPAAVPRQSPARPPALPQPPSLPRQSAAGPAAASPSPQPGTDRAGEHTSPRSGAARPGEPVALPARGGHGERPVPQPGAAGAGGRSGEPPGVPGVPVPLPGAAGAGDPSGVSSGADRPGERCGPRSDADRSGDFPAPLPVRGSHEERPNPAEARPGIRAGERQAVAEHLGAPPVPRTGAPPAPRTAAAAAATDRPRLPRRRDQENLVPQLRGGPAPRRYDEHVGHDPGLMAAFRRGISLAETQETRRTAPAERPPRTPAPQAQAPAHGETAAVTATTSSALLDLTAARAARAEPPTGHDGNEPAG
ncbi:ATP-binding protein [Streptomyces sp. NPDC047000]|uniref:sensor histidine kinase n=1 Tax=Streptomyces sp. NPDC047000 TaxID=3155474 RepID=UPI0033FB6D9F